MDRRLPCQACGTWTCAACGWQRHGASLSYAGQHSCARCGGTAGALRPTRHGTSTGIYEDHNPTAGPVCAVWYSRTALRWQPCEHKTCMSIRWPGRGR